MPSNSEYPCPKCKQGHCVCYDTDEAKAARFARKYTIEDIRCAMHPEEPFISVNALNEHVAKKHAQTFEPALGSRNGATPPPNFLM